MQEDIEIKEFLEGHNSKKYVIAVETDFGSNKARVYSQSPDTNDKKMELIPFKPFIYIKDFKRLGVKLYDDNRDRLSAAMRRHEIKVKPMRVTDDNGGVVERLDNGYKYLVQTNSSKGYAAINNFFKEGGVDIWHKKGKKLSFGLRRPNEIEKTDGLYTLLDQDGSSYFLYNNVRSQYEIHVPAMYISRFTEKNEDGEGFIRLKGDKVDLLNGIDFDVHYYEPKDKFVIVLKSKEDVAKSKIIAKRNQKEEDEIFFESEEIEEPADITADDIEVFHSSEEDYWNKFEHPKVLKWISDKGDNIDGWKEQLDLVLKYLKEDKNWSKEDLTERKALVKEKNKYDKAKLKAIIHREKQAAILLREEEDEAERIATATKKYRDIRYSYNKLTIEFTETNSTLFFGVKREEQFMIDTGIRLFKGIDNYADVHKVTFDIETTGLDPKVDRTFLIGVKDNRGNEKVFGVARRDDDEEERKMYEHFFLTLNWLNASIIFGYNSENFDFDFIFVRCDILNFDFEKMPDSVKFGINLLRKEGRSIKFGGETETYTQTIIRGKTVLDIYHAVRRTMAINSDIISGTLKNICKHEGIAKANRTYVPGNKIYTIWRDAKLHAVNKESGEYEEVADKTCMLYDDLTMFKTGKEIVEQYLIDDLWETEQVDARYNEDKFLIGKLLPTSFLRTCTMGGASLWNLIMATWSYERGLAIPYALQAQTFTGGLSRTFMLGKFKNVYKFDFSGLYPSLQLEHGIFPKHDVMNGLKRLLLYFKNTRDHFKFLAGDNSPLPEIERKPFKAKQLPLKIMNNSNFGANGSAYFNWADFTCAEKITCLGRLYLRNMIQFFMKWGCVPTVCDSVTGETPIYIKRESGIDIVPIEDLFDENSKELDAEGLRDYSKKPFQVLTRNGWKEMTYAYRHGTSKQIHEIITKNRMVQVTEDHSLFQNGEEVKPVTLLRGDKIDIMEIPVYDNSDKIPVDLAYLYGFFLGDGHASETKKTLRGYVSKKTGDNKAYVTTRTDFKLSNQDDLLLTGLGQVITTHFPHIKTKLYNHMESSHVYNLVFHNAELTRWFKSEFYTKNGFKKIPSFILNASAKTKEAFLDGFYRADGYGNDSETVHSFSQKSQTAMAGIAYILQQLGTAYKVSTRSDKRDIRFSFAQGRAKATPVMTKMKEDEVWFNKKIANRDKNGYVYDISTEDGTFVGGIGGIILHNTDGINMEVPTEVNVDIQGMPLDSLKSIDQLRYTQDGKEYVGADALVAKYNSEVLHSEFMKLDNDGMWPSALNVSRKNYANMEPPKEDGKEGKIKFVGNSLKQKTMPAYIKEFMNKGIKLILLDKGKEFVEYYYEYLAQIYTMQVPLMKIANKARVKQTPEEYVNRGVDKNGRQKGRQAHMELIVQMDKKVDLGDIVYYISTGERKSHGYTTINKATNQLRAYLITEQEFEQEPDKLGSYNVAKYIDAFNSRISVLLTCFKPDVRETLIKAMPTEREYYTNRQMELISLKNPRLEDDIDQFFILADSEVDFWNRTGFDPRQILEDFTTLKPFDGYEFQDAINKLKPQLKNSGYNLKAYYENYSNDDLVLSFKRKPYILVTETEEKVYVGLETMSYLEDPFKIPFDSKKYNEVLHYRKIMSNGCSLKMEKEFILNKVNQGELLELKRF